RHLRLERVRLDVHPHGQPIAKAGLLNLKITRQKVQFLTQGDFLRARVLQCSPQQIAQTAQDSVSGFDILMHESGNAVQSIKQEVRVQLHLQRLELCFCQVFFQFEAAQFTLAKFFIVIKGVDDTDNHAINEEVEMPHFDQERLEGSREKQRIAAER